MASGMQGQSPPVTGDESSARMLQQVADQSPNAIIVTDSERRIEYVNHSFCLITGYGAAEAIGQRAGFMASGETPRATFDSLNVALAEGRPWKGEFLNRHKDGQIRVDFAHVAPIRQEDGRVTHYLSIQEDITERKRMGEELDRHRYRLEELVAERTRQLEAATAEARRSTQLLHEALNSLTQGFAIMDPEGRLLLCNEAHQSFYASCRDLMRPGVSAETIFRAAVARGLFPDAIGREDAWLSERLANFQRADVEPFEQHLADGRWLLVSEARTPAGFLVGNRTDITELKLTQQALTEARDAAEAANRAKSFFLANMSHEIRTPMNAIIGLTHLCLQQPLAPRARDYVGKIENAATLLLGTINDILDFSKIEAGKLEIERRPFHLEEELSAVANLFQSMAQQKGLTLHLDIAPDIPGELVGDALRLRQILSNLISNAIKFSSQGGISVGVSGRSSGGAQVRLLFTVSDQGIGIRREQMATLFQAFSQADASVSRCYGGSGLGLAICKELLEVMGGEIGVESTPGKGTTFRFSLPFALAERSGRQENGMDRGRVLLVEDDRIQRRIMQRMLEDFGFRVSVAESGEQALALAAELPAAEAFSLLLLDFRLPGIDGMETGRRLRSLPACVATPALMVTGVDIEEIRLLQAGGIEQFLFKPIRRSSLFDAVQGILSLSAPAALPASPAGDAPAFAGKTVLLVEDNEFNQLVGRDLLEMYGAQVSVVENGLLAVELLAHESFDLVLMDMQMPVMDGVSATRAIRSRPELAALPIVAMTANVLAEERERCLAAGMNDFIGKPIVPEHLFRCLSRWLIGDKEEAPPAKETRPASDGPGVAAVIDPAACIFYAGGKRESFLRLLRHFAAARAQAGHEVRQLCQQGDTVGAQRLLHSLKGAAVTLGAQPLATSAAALEFALKQGSGEAVLDVLLDDFVSALAAVLAEIDVLSSEVGDT